MSFGELMIVALLIYHQTGSVSGTFWVTMFLFVFANVVNYFFGVDP